MPKKKLDTQIVSVRNIRRAHRRNLPKVLTEINKKLRAGARRFRSIHDFPEGMYGYVVEALQKVPGLHVGTNTMYGYITIWLPGEPLTNVTP